jgi:SAM-dependent methyltransferase
VKEWFQDESFWDEFAPFMFDETRWMLADLEVERIQALTGISPPARVLDLCCGVGRHSLAFARRGFAVTAVDMISSYLEAAEESAKAANLTIEFIKADARKFERCESFDLCVNLGASFGYSANKRGDAQMLRHAYENLAPAGAFVLETMGKETVARLFKQSETFTRDGWEVSARYRILGDWEKLDNHWRAQKDHIVYERNFAIRLYSGTEIKKAVSKAGFGEVVLYGDLDGRNYDQDAEMQVVLARRQKAFFR